MKYPDITLSYLMNVSSFYVVIDESKEEDWLGVFKDRQYVSLDLDNRDKYLANKIGILVKK